MADLAATRAMLESLPVRDVLGRVGFQARIEELEEAAQALGRQSETHASAALYFGGAPVIGSSGIEADFASAALGQYQDLVATVMAARESGGQLAAAGPIPGRKAATLHVTNVLHGSFGFQVQELSNERTLIGTSPKEAVDETTSMIAAFGDDDEQRYLEVFDDIGERVLAAIGNFFKTLDSEKATFRLVAGEVDTSFPAERIKRAVDRASTTTMHEDEITVTGMFWGSMMGSRSFEVRRAEDGTVLRGKLASAVTADQIQNWNRLTGVVCEARLIHKRVSRNARAYDSYLLLGLDRHAED